MNSITYIYKVYRTENFKVICCDIYDDKRLSWKAKGLHTFLMSRPENWTLNRQHILSMSTDKKGSYDSGIQELKDFGYLRITKKGFTWTWEVSEAPEMMPTTETVATTGELPSTRFSSTRKTSIRKPARITRRSKQEEYKQEGESKPSLKSPILKSTEPVIDFIGKDYDYEEGTAAFCADVVKYWAQELLRLHAIKIPLTEDEIAIKGKDVEGLQCHNLGDGKNETLKEYIDWYLQDYDAAEKRYSWRWLNDVAYKNRFMRERGLALALKP